ncbi:hypothetical protein AB0L13_02695 [Saccharopolyspora shandongensis]
MNYQDRVRAHVEELRSTPDVVMRTSEIGSGPPRELSGRRRRADRHRLG